MKKIKIIISIFLCILLIGGIGYFWVTASAGPSLKTAENALANKHLIAFAHLDNKKINTIANAIGEELNPSFLEEKNSVLKALYFGSSNFKENVYQVMYGLSYNQTDSKAINSLLLHGLFSWQSMEEVLKQHFTIEALGEKKFELQPNITTSVDSYTCPDETKEKPPTNTYVYVSSDWLILSDNLNQVDTLLSRMENKDEAYFDLTPWRNYRSGKLASFALYNPEHVGKSLGGMSGYIVGGVYKKNTPISAIFSSLDLSYLNPGIHLNSQVIANKDWAVKYALEGNNKIAEAKLAAKDYSPVLVNLLNTLQISDDSDSLYIDLVVTQRDIEKIPEALSEIFSSFFSMSAGNLDRKEDIIAESINESPWDYANNKKLGSPPSFKSGTFSGIPSLIDGAFAINMEKVSIGEKSGLVELDLKGLMSIEKIKGFWSNSKANLSLSIDSVIGANQQELLKDERCDKKLPMFTSKNQQAVEGFHIISSNSNSDDHAYVEKKIRLIPDAKFSQIEEIKGSLRLHAPVGVKLVEVDFQKGKSFKDKTLEFIITKTQQQTVTYKIKGQSENILEIRALNEKGQVLYFYTSFGNDNGKTASYKGDIAKLQLVIVNQWLDKKIDFAIKSKDFLKGKASSQYKINQLPSRATKKNIAVFSKANLAEVTAKKIKKVTYSTNAVIGSTEISPVKLFVSHDYKSNWNFQPKLQVAMPLIEALAFNLQAVEVEIAQEAPFKTFINGFTDYTIKSIGKYRGQLKVGEFEYNLKKVDLKLPLESGQKLSSLKGNFIYRLPKKVQYIDLAFPDLGQEINAAGTKLTLTAIKTGVMANYIFAVSGDDLINIVAITEQGSFYPTQQRFKDGKWQLKFGLHPKIHSLRVVVSTEKEKVITPFEIDLNYD